MNPRSVIFTSILVYTLGLYAGCAVLDAAQICINDGTLFGCTDDPIVIGDDTGTPEGNTTARLNRAREMAKWPMPTDPRSGNYRNEDSDSIKDLTTTLVWQAVAARAADGTSIGTFTYEEAATLCDELAEADANGDDPAAQWRLPTRIELLSLVNQQTLNPATTFPDPDMRTGSADLFFWSSTQSAASTVPQADEAWMVDFTEGIARLSATSVPRHVRCVRIDSTSLDVQYLQNPDSMQDQFTGLRWAREISATELSLVDAQTYCGALRVDGFANWRLPHMQELRTLVDPTRFFPAVDESFAAITPNESFWSATPASNPEDGTLTVFFGDGSENSIDSEFGSALVRCVR